MATVLGSEDDSTSCGSECSPNLFCLSLLILEGEKYSLFTLFIHSLVDSCVSWLGMGPTTLAYQSNTNWAAQPRPNFVFWVSASSSDSAPLSISFHYFKIPIYIYNALALFLLRKNLDTREVFTVLSRASRFWKVDWSSVLFLCVAARVNYTVTFPSFSKHLGRVIGVWHCLLVIVDIKMNKTIPILNQLSV